MICINDNQGPIIVRLLEAITHSGVIDDREMRKIIKKITGVSKQNLQHWLNGTTSTPGVDHIVKLSDHFNIDLNWLITGNTIKHSSKNSKYSGTVNQLKTDDLVHNASKCSVIKRLCIGIEESGIVDVKESLKKASIDIEGFDDKNVDQWLNNEYEPSLSNISMLCEFYGVATRYVASGIGPVMALNNRTNEVNSKNNKIESVNLNDVTILGNA